MEQAKDYLTLFIMFGTAATLVFSLTPKGWPLFVRFANWLNRNVFATDLYLRVERLEHKHAAHVEAPDDFGIC